MAKPKRAKKPVLSDGNCQRDGAPYQKRAGLWVCPTCGGMRSLDYEANPYYSGTVRHPPAESVDGGSRRLPTNTED